MEASSKADQELEKVERQIAQLETVAEGNPEARKQLRNLHGRVEGLRRQVKANYDAWQRTELARHPQRPYMLDFVQHMFTDFSPALKSVGRKVTESASATLERDQDLG